MGFWGFLSFDKNYNFIGKENKLKVEKMRMYNEKVFGIYCGRIGGFAFFGYLGGI